MEGAERQTLASNLQAGSMKEAANLANGSGMTTEEIMGIALEMAGQREIPPDSAIYVPGKDIRRVLFGIDMGVPELILAKDLGFDAVIAHHPQPAVLSFPDILDLHVDIMVRNGVPESAARKAIASLKEANFMRGHSGNYDHAPSVARLLGMPYLNIHNPLDELGRRALQGAIDSRVGPDGTVADVVAALQTVPALAAAPTKPFVAVGRPENPAGKVVVAHGAGTNGGYEVAKTYFEYGIGTVVYIHLDYGATTRLRAEDRGNVVVSGHIASDKAGIDPFVEELERRGLVVERMSGL